MTECVRLTMSLGPADKGHSPFPSSERAVYGFAKHLASYVFAVTFLLWAFLPDTWLYSIGFIYFPQKYWAVAGPAYLCVGLVMFIVLYFAGNLLLVPSLSSPNTITDVHSLPPSQPPPHTHHWIPSLHDIPISKVNKSLFIRRHKRQ